MSFAVDLAGVSASPIVAVVGAGPAGLMAADCLRALGARVHVFDAMPSAGRKFLLAGIGGLNLTHAESAVAFLARYGERARALAPWLEAFDADAVRAWAQALGIETFVGSSGRVFPKDMKAAPLLRTWLQRLRAGHGGGLPVQFHMRQRWLGWAAVADRAIGLRLGGPVAESQFACDAAVLALGGASWPRLGSDGAWVPLLRERGVEVARLQPANCGFDIAATAAGRNGWSDYLRTRFAGAPIKPVALTWIAGDGVIHRRQGEFVLTQTGVEGSLIYAFSAALRERIVACGRAVIQLDLLPQHSLAQVMEETHRPRGARSLSTHLKSRLGIQGAKAALVHEVLETPQLDDPVALAQALKGLTLTLAAPRPLDEAISTAGGVRFEALDAHAMLRAMPGVFCAGEMLDWEAPTGGYLLTACLASGRAAGHGAMRWLTEGT